VTVTVAVFEADPPAPLQVSTKLVVCVSAAVTCVPDVNLDPLHPPDAVHDVALVEDQFRVALPPCATWAGVAEIVTVGTGGVALTATVAVCDAVPPAPVQASV
jgi:hypothetical protein